MPTKHCCASYIEVCDGALTTLTDALIALGFEPTSRLKNRETILDKVRRDSKVTRIRDIAGCRIVVSGTRSEQDQVVSACAAHFEQSRIIDRRSDPKSGYRAVHVEAVVDERPVEIQVRTRAQHQWAELFERLGDVVGREIRYGKPIVIAIRRQEFSEQIQDVVDRIVDSMSSWSEALHKEEIADQKVASVHHQSRTLESQMTAAEVLAG